MSKHTTKSSHISSELIFMVSNNTIDRCSLLYNLKMRKKELNLYKPVKKLDRPYLTPEEIN